MNRRVIGALLGVLLILAAFYACAKDGSAGTDEDCFRRHTNAERARRGIPRLSDDPRIDGIAERHSARMARDETTYHNDNLAAEYKSYEYGGENVGMGSGCEPIQAAFMASPGHKANILDRDYEQLGVGVTLRDDTIYVVLDFFTPKAAQPARPSASSRTSRPTPRPQRSCG